MIKLLFRKKFLIITLVLLLAVLPVALTMQSTVLSKLIVTTIGLEKAGDDYTVHIEHLIFNFDPFGVPEREILSATSPTIDQAFSEIGKHKGRTVSLSHCTVIILGRSLIDEEENLAELLLPFIKRADISNCAAVFFTEVDVEKLLNASNDTGDVRSGLIQQIAVFNKKNNGKTHYYVTLEDFVRGLKKGRAKLPIIGLDEDGALVNVNTPLPLKY